MTLAQLPVGQFGMVLSITAEGPIRRRILDLGLVPGTVVKALRTSPAGDPLPIWLEGLSLHFVLKQPNRYSSRCRTKTSLWQ